MTYDIKIHNAELARSCPVCTSERKLSADHLTADPWSGTVHREAIDEAYPEFESVPHRALRRFVTQNLRTAELDCRDDADSENPPAPDRKVTFPPAEHPLA